jgi:hypothetical protein
MKECSRHPLYQSSQNLSAQGSIKISRGSFVVTTIRILLRKKKRHKWFIDIANKIQEKFESIWESSEKGYVWTHKRHGGKIRFMMRTVRNADVLKVWHPSRRDRFKQAQAIGDFVQWIYEHGREDVKTIQILVRK